MTGCLGGACHTLDALCKAWAMQSCPLCAGGQVQRIEVA